MTTLAATSDSPNGRRCAWSCCWVDARQAHAWLLRWHQVHTATAQTDTQPGGCCITSYTQDVCRYSARRAQRCSDTRSTSTITIAAAGFQTGILLQIISNVVHRAWNAVLESSKVLSVVARDKLQQAGRCVGCSKLVSAAGSGAVNGSIGIQKLATCAMPTWPERRASRRCVCEEVHCAGVKFVTHVAS